MRINQLTISLQTSLPRSGCIPHRSARSSLWQVFHSPLDLCIRRAYAPLRRQYNARSRRHHWRGRDPERTAEQCFGPGRERRAIHELRRISRDGPRRDPAPRRRQGRSGARYVLFRGSRQGGIILYSMCLVDSTPVSTSYTSPSTPESSYGREYAIELGLICCRST